MKFHIFFIFILLLILSCDQLAFNNPEDNSNSKFSSLKYISVNSPVAGDNWDIASNQTISWSASDNVTFSEVQIDLYKGNTLIQNIANNIKFINDENFSYESNDSNGKEGEYGYNVLFTLSKGSDYKIRVTAESYDYDNGDIDTLLYGESENFTIKNDGPPIYFMISSPNGGEEWAIGTTQTISWLTNNTLTRKSENIGSMDTSTDQMTAINYNKTNEESISGLNKSQISNSNNSDKPNIIKPSNNNNIYTNTNIDSSSVDSVKIDLYKAGVIYRTIVNNAYNSNNYNWYIDPDSIFEAIDYKIRISSISDVSIYNESYEKFSILESPYYVIATPNGGEIWHEGTSRTITWTASDVLSSSTLIELFYSTDAGASWEEITYSNQYNTYDYNDGELSWTIPEQDQTNYNCLMRIWSYYDNSIYDISDEYFTITADSSYILVTYPNESESLAIGCTYDITWASTSSSSMPRISSQINDNKIIDVEKQILSNKKLRDSNSPIISKEHKQIIDPNDETNSKSLSSKFSVNRKSAKTKQVSIKKLSRESSNDGHNLEKLTSSSDINYFTVSVYMNDSFYQTLSSYLYGNSYSWTVPSDWDKTANYKIRVSDYNNSAMYDESDVYFSIDDDSSNYKLTSPNGEEEWHEGTTKTIEWTTFGCSLSDYVNLYYSILDSADADTSWSSIITYSFNTTGQYSWTVPNQTENQTSFLIKVQDSYDNSIYDISDNYFTITADSNYYKITSPNGGETWDSNSSEAISWTKGGDDLSSYVNLYYSLDSGENWIEIVTHSSSYSSYNWTLPSSYVSNSTCLIKITDYSNSNFYDICDTTFTINSIATSNQLSVLTPNGEEEWNESTTKTITWDNTGNIGELYAVRIAYSTDGGSNWKNINGSTSTSDPPSSSWPYILHSGQEDWTLPSITNTSHSALVGIWAASYDSVFDISDDFFTMKADTNYYEITSPIGGEQWTEGTTQTITWNSSGNDLSNYVSLKYSTNGGNDWTNISTSLYNSSGTYSWPIPSITTDYDICYVKIEDYNDNSIYDISDNYFSMIAEPNEITILSPNGGEEFEIGTDRYILWESSGDVSNYVKIQISINGGSSWQNILNESISDVSNQSNSGSYLMYVTDYGENTNSKIKISDTDNSSIYDESDAVFSLVAVESYDMNFENGEEAGWDFGGNWSIISTDSYSGDYAAKGSSCNTQTLSKTQTVNAGTISFYYKTDFSSSSSSYGYFKFKIDGTEILFTGDQSTWKLYEADIEAGEHIFSWVHYSQYCSSSYYTKIDAIKFP